MSGIPFLCNFVDKVDETSKIDYPTDFRYFLTDEIKLLPENRNYSNNCVLILSRILDEEADMVCIELLRRGIDYFRLNAEEVHRSLSVANFIEQESDAGFNIKLRSRMVNLSDISAVWLRHFDYNLIQPNNKDLSTAFIFQQWSDALDILYDALKNKWINSLGATDRANNHITQLTYAKRAGFNIPSTLITNDSESARRFYLEHDCNILLKVLHQHDIEVNNKIYSIYSHRVTDKDIPKLEDLQHAPCILQERIPNCSEVRVTVVKDKVFAAQLGSENLASNCEDDIHRIPLSKLPRRPFVLEKRIEERCIEVVKSLGLNYGAIDLLLSEDKTFFFLEINPTGDWLWIERETNLPITKSVVDLIECVMNSTVTKEESKIPSMT